MFPILIIDDDQNDADVIEQAIIELGVHNEIKKFDGAQVAINYLMTTNDTPLVILCDIRMPVLDGLSFLKHIHTTEYLRRKSIPFIFFTGIVTDDIIDEAFIYSVQGFFKKAASYTELKEQLLSVLMYWKRSLHPNSKKAG
jgi:CheY-like chemotaxis protein